MLRCTATPNFLPGVWDSNLGLHVCKVSTLTHRVTFPGSFFNLQIVLPSSMILCFPAEHLDLFSSEGCLSLHLLQSSLCGRETQDTCGLESTPLLCFAYTPCIVLILSTVKVSLLWCNVCGTKNGTLVLYVFLELGISPFWRAWCVGEEWLRHGCSACTVGSPLHC